MQSWEACNFIKKETATQVFSCEFCEIFKNTFFTEEAVVRKCSVKKVFLKISQNSQENTGAGVSISIKLQAVCNFNKKGGSGKGPCLWILWNFSAENLQTGASIWTNLQN